MDNDTTAQNDDTSTNISSGEGNSIDTNPDAFFEQAFLNATDGLLGDVEVNTSSDEEKSTEDLEVSGEAEQEAPGDDSNIETDTDESESEEVEEALPVVDYDEAKQFQFELDGKLYSVNDFKSWKGQIEKQENARTEVETARQELETQREELAAQRGNLEAAQTVSGGMQQMAQLQNAYNHLNNQRQAAMQKKDGNAVSLIEAQIRDLSTKGQQLQAQVEQAEAQQAQAAADSLDKFGFGSLKTDEQRLKAFQTYAQDNVPPNLIKVVNTNPELLAILEKARLYDKSNGDLPKAKLKGAKVTMKGGAAKSPKRKSKDPLEQAFFNATSDMDFKT